jgi:hypothetical protein
LDPRRCGTSSRAIPMRSAIKNCEKSPIVKTEAPEVLAEDMVEIS